MDVLKSVNSSDSISDTLTWMMCSWSYYSVKILILGCKYELSCISYSSYQNFYSNHHVALDRVVDDMSFSFLYSLVYIPLMSSSSKTCICRVILQTLWEAHVELIKGYYLMIISIYNDTIYPSLLFPFSITTLSRMISIVYIYMYIFGLFSLIHSNDPTSTPNTCERTSEIKK